MSLFSNRILEKTPKTTDQGKDPSMEQSFWVMLTFFGLPHFIFTSLLHGSILFYFFYRWENWCSGIISTSPIGCPLSNEEICIWIKACLSPQHLSWAKSYQERNITEPLLSSSLSNGYKVDDIRISHVISFGNKMIYSELNTEFTWTVIFITLIWKIIIIIIITKPTLQDCHCDHKNYYK